LYMEPRKPIEELYDLDTDPDEVHNLAGAPEFQERLDRMRGVLHDWMLGTRDLGLLDEAEMHHRANGDAEHDLGKNSAACDLPRILETAGLHRRGAEAIPELMRRLADSDSAVRYWAVVGLHVVEADEEGAIEALTAALADESPSVAMAAGAALCHAGLHDAAQATLMDGLTHESAWVRLRAAIVLDMNPAHAGPALDALRRACDDDNRYVSEVARHAVAALEE